MSDLTDVLHWLRASNWAGVELGKAAQTLDVITELQAENKRLREALEQIERRATGRGNGAAVICTMQTLGAIARGALEGGQ